MGEPQAATSYEVIGKLADGDVAELFLAKAATGAGAMERLVVVKRIPRKVTQNTELVRSFLDEAAIAARLQHPNIAQVFEVGKLGGSYFFAMEYINGETLRALIDHARAKKIQIPIRSVVTIAAGAVAGLHHAHDRAGIDGKPLGLVHGDISPTNLLVSREGIVKVVDFGIAKARKSHSQSPLTKIPYWSPEQCRGDTLDRRSDLFSLGVVLWELVTLEDLFHRGGDAKTRAAIENEDAPPPSARRYDVPPELDVIIQRLVAKKADDRYKDADEALAALEGLASKLGFQLSTAELSRMMRLWFGNVPDPVLGPSDKPLVVRSEPVPDNLSIAPAADPIDGLLDNVRNATEMIRAAAAALGSARSASVAPPVIGDTVETTRENFQQIRDRILAQARTKKATRPPPVGAGAPAAADAGAADAATGARPKRETLNSANNAYSFMTNLSGKPADPIRKLGITTPPMGTALATAAADGAVATDTPAGIESSGTPNDASVAAATAPVALTTRGMIGTKTASFEAVAEPVINDAIALTSDAVSKAADAPKLDAAAGAAATADSAATDAKVATEPKAAASAVDTKVEDAKDSKADAKTDAKDKDAKTDAKADVKADAKDAKADAKDAKADAKDTKADAKDKDKDKDAKADATDKDAKTDAKDKDAKATKDAKKDGREAPPASAARAVRADAPRAVASEDVDDDEIAGKRPGWMLPAGLAAAAVVVILILFKMKGGGSHTTQNQHNPPPPVTSDATEVAMATPDAAEVAMATPDAAEVAMATPDAAVAMVTPDAAEVAMATPDAAVAMMRPDAAVKERPDAAVKERPDAAVREPRPDAAVKEPKPDAAVKEPKDAEKSIEDLVANGDFVKANKACKGNTIFNSGRLTACTIAACNAKDTALAQRWIRAIEKGARADLIKTCTALGVTVTDPSAPPAP